MTPSEILVLGYVIGAALMATAALCGAMIGMKFEKASDWALLCFAVFGWPVAIPYYFALRL